MKEHRLYARPEPDELPHFLEDLYESAKQVNITAANKAGHVVDGMGLTMAGSLQDYP
jgi:hypothetical protein